MPEFDLKLHGRDINTVFDLLGKDEDDITYSVGWGLAQSEAFVRALLTEVFGDAEQGAIVAIRLQETQQGAGRTDIEIETEHLHLILEAKRGWTLPERDQLDQYAPRLHGTTEQAIVVVAECSDDYAHPSLAAMGEFDARVVYRSWQVIAAMVEGIAAKTTSHKEKSLLRELVRYLRGLLTTQSITSNMVYVVSLGLHHLDWSKLNFADIVMKENMYFHPVGGNKGGWPRTPPNYIGFRFHGQLQRISFVEKYDIITEPHRYIPGINEDEDWSDDPHFLYYLGPAIKPDHEVRTGKLYRSARVWCAFDTLFTSSTIAEARDRTRDRLESAGEG